MTNKQSNKSLERFCKAILTLENIDECKSFFEDAFTFQEFDTIANRFEVAVLLIEGKNYTEINEITGASTATISRVNRALNYGNGGYRRVIERLENGDE